MAKQKGVVLKIDEGSLVYLLPARAQFGGFRAFAKVRVIESSGLTQAVVDLAESYVGGMHKAVLTRTFIELYTRGEVKTREDAITIATNFVESVQTILAQPERNRARARAQKAAARSSHYVNRH